VGPRGSPNWLTSCVLMLMSRANNFEYARSQVLTIGELAQRTGVATTALRYYDELDLVSPAARSGGQRRYDDAAVRQVGVVLLLRDLGFTLAEIARFVRGGTDRQGRDDLVRSKIAELDALIRDAEVARLALVHALACPADDPRACPKFLAVVDGRLDGRTLAEPLVP
jgi:DNA-binding transcriptional MerR regulator